MPDGPRSPCIGVCSTTYGDLICRGCHRFAHEVAEWNAYDEAQQATVLNRLADFRAGTVRRHLTPTQIDQLAQQAASVKLRRIGDRSPEAFAYEVLRRLSLWRRPLPWPSGEGDGATAAQRLLEQIDQEMRQRCEAHYERSFRIAAR